MTTEFTAPPLPGSPLEPDPNPMAGYSAAGTVDRLADDTGPEHPATDLQALLAEVAQVVPVQIRSWIVPAREGWAAAYRLDLTEEDISRARRRATVGKARMPGQDDIVDNVAMNAQLLGKYHDHLTRGGVRVLGTDGEALTFRHRELQAAYSVDSAAACAVAFYGRDGDLLAAGSGLLRGAGWMNDAQEADPDDLSPTRV